MIFLNYLEEFIINGVNYTLASLPSSLLLNGPLNVIGNPDFETYTIEGLTGNVSVFSTEQVYLSYYGSSGAATYGGFYSGFTFKPEIVFQPVTTTQSNCIPDINLNVNAISNFDSYQWYYNGIFRFYSVIFHIMLLNKIYFDIYNDNSIRCIY